MQIDLSDVISGIGADRTVSLIYDSDTIEITPGMEPQVAVLKFVGVNEQPDTAGERKNKGSGLLRKLWKH